MNETNGVAQILGNPEGCIREMVADVRPWRRIPILLAMALGGAALFGLAIGSFVGWGVALIDAVKLVETVLFSYVLCLPTLWVFSVLAGSQVGFLRMSLFGLMVLAGLGCILAALAPVLWLFAVSTESSGMFVILSFVLVVVVAILGARIIGAARSAGLVARTAGLSAWFVILLIVAFQTITVIRPMLTSDASLSLGRGHEKCLFLSHFVESLFKG